MKKLLLLVVIACILYFIFHRPDEASDVNSLAPASENSNSYTPSTSGDFGSGHQAGYDWRKATTLQMKATAKLPETIQIPYRLLRDAKHM
jgi:hypothetical protein